MSDDTDWLSLGLKHVPEARWRGLRFEAPATIGSISARILTIGAWSYIQNGAEMSGKVVIGRYCSIAENFLTHLADHPTHWLSTSTSQYQRSQFDHWMLSKLPLRKKSILNPRRPGVIIGNDVWIGRNVTIPRGCSVGDGAIIATGSIVTKDVPPYAVVGGVPARTIRMRFDDELVQRLTDSKWWQYDRNDLGKITFEDPHRALDEIHDLVETGKITPRAKEYQRHPGLHD